MHRTANYCTLHRTEVADFTAAPWEFAASADTVFAR